MKHSRPKKQGGRSRERKIIAVDATSFVLLNLFKGHPFMRILWLTLPRINGHMSLLSHSAPFSHSLSFFFGMLLEKAILRGNLGIVRRLHWWDLHVPVGRARSPSSHWGFPVYIVWILCFMGAAVKVFLPIRPILDLKSGRLMVGGINISMTAASWNSWTHSR